MSVIVDHQLPVAVLRAKAHYRRLRPAMLADVDQAGNSRARDELPALLEYGIRWPVVLFRGSVPSGEAMLAKL